MNELLRAKKLIDQAGLYRDMLTAREVDKHEQLLVRQGLAFFQLSCSGHEANAALASYLQPHDFLHLHYRDKALLLARGFSVNEFFLSLLARDGSNSAGRQMNAMYSCKALNVLSMVTPVGNNALQAVGVAAAIRDADSDPIVVCSVGDGTTQQGEFLEAIAECARNPAPVLFLIEDNGWAISTSTRRKTFYQHGTGTETSFFGIQIVQVDGSNPREADACFQKVVGQVRSKRQAIIIVFRVERLCDHTSADDQFVYRNDDSISSARDPVANLEQELIDKQGQAFVDSIKEAVEKEIKAAIDAALNADQPQSEFTAKRPLPEHLLATELPLTGPHPRRTIRESLNQVLSQRLERDGRVFLTGQDIEDPKGDVFGVTKGLSTSCPGRVVNSALTESTIVGTCIGRSLAGQLPVGFIQFADFLPLAQNQIVSELGSIYWRSGGQWNCPVILMVACGAYRAGLGPFHAQTMEAFAVHASGLDVVMPNNAYDAAGLLNTAFDSKRPTIFFYPKALLNSVDYAKPVPTLPFHVPLGKASHISRGDDLTMVTWGAAIEECRQATEVLIDAGFSVDLIDLRSLSPWDRETVCKSVRRTSRLIVVHEDNRSCGLGAEIGATVMEQLATPFAFARIARPDTHIPFNYDSQREVLPSCDSILMEAARQLDAELNWSSNGQLSDGLIAIPAIGSGPADDLVEVIEVFTTVGAEVAVGQTIAELEASKSAVDVVSNVAGAVVEITAKPQTQVRVGDPLIVVRSNSNRGATPKQTSQSPRFSIRRRTASTASRDSESISNSAKVLEMSHLPNEVVELHATRSFCSLGSQSVPTSKITEHMVDWTPEEAIKRTGVESRPWIKEGESVVTLARDAVAKLMSSIGECPPLSAIICSTTSPCEATPSISCQAASTLPIDNSVHAFDINAACSGFLYALKLAFDEIGQNPERAVLVITAEVLSPGIAPNDPSTAFLFGDAATATLVTKEKIGDESLRFRRPLLRFSPDLDRSLWAPNMGVGYMKMDGIAVARQANKDMARVMQATAQAYGVDISSLARVIPHPGSKRILRSVAGRLEIDESVLLHTLKTTGNTSSSSIPLAIDQRWDEIPRNQPIGFFAFGAGFTSAATIGWRS